MIGKVNYDSACDNRNGPIPTFRGSASRMDPLHESSHYLCREEILEGVNSNPNTWGGNLFPPDKSAWETDSGLGAIVLGGTLSDPLSKGRLGPLWCNGASGV